VTSPFLAEAFTITTFAKLKAIHETLISKSKSSGPYQIRRS